MPGSKLRRRAFTVLASAANSLLVPGFNILISSLVVRLADETLWGAFVTIMILVQFGAHIAGWGNKEYLLRAFSREPGNIAVHWQRSIATRLLLVFALIGLLFAFGNYPLARLGWMAVWGSGIMLAQSFEVMIFYRRHFGIALMIEAVAALVLGIFIITANNTLTVDLLLMAFVLVTWGKVLIYALCYREILRPSAYRVDAAYFSGAFTFFLLGFSGLLASRIDLYAISALLDAGEVGWYQIFINMLLYVQAMANFIMLPFIRNFYRLPDAAIMRVAGRLFFMGMVLTIPAMLGIIVMLWLLYDLRYDNLFLLLGAAFVIPIYGYLPLIYRLYKHDRQRLVLWVNLAGAGINLVATLLLVPVIGSSGALLASTLVQWGMLLVYLRLGSETQSNDRSSPATPIELTSD